MKIKSIGIVLVNKKISLLNVFLKKNRNDLLKKAFTINSNLRNVFRKIIRLVAYSTNQIRKTSVDLDLISQFWGFNKKTEITFYYTLQVFVRNIKSNIGKLMTGENRVPNYLACKTRVL